MAFSHHQSNGLTNTTNNCTNDAYGVTSNGVRSDERKLVPHGYYDYTPQYALQAGHGFAASSGDSDGRSIPELLTPEILAHANAVGNHGLQPSIPRSAPGPLDALGQHLQAPSPHPQYPPALPPTASCNYSLHTPHGHGPYANVRPQPPVHLTPTQHVLRPSEPGNINPMCYGRNPHALAAPQPPVNTAAAQGDQLPYAQDQRRQVSIHRPLPHHVTAQASLPRPRGPVQLRRYATRGYAPPPLNISRTLRYRGQPGLHAMVGAAGSTSVLPAHGTVPAPAVAEQRKVLAGPHKGRRVPGKRTAQGLGDPVVSLKAIKVAKVLGGPAPAPPRKLRIEALKACAPCQMGGACGEIVDGKKCTWGRHFKERHADECSYMAVPKEGEESVERWRCVWPECRDKTFCDEPGLGEHVISKHHGQSYLCTACPEAMAKTYSKTSSLTRHFKDKHVSIILVVNEEEAGPSM